MCNPEERVGVGGRYLVRAVVASSGPGAALRPRHDGGGPQG